MDLKQKLCRWGLYGALGLMGLGLVCAPGSITQAARDGVTQCLTVVIPSLFPFLVLSSLVVSLGIVGRLGRWLSPVISPLFHVSGAGGVALLLGLVGGYPVGARTVGELYRSGGCSKAEAERLLVFCNNCGPAFLLSTAGSAVFGSLRAGYLLWAGHLLSALAIGILLPGRTPRNADPVPASSSPSIAQAVTAAVVGGGRSVLQLSAFVVAFGVVVRMLDLIHLPAALAQLAHLLFGVPVQDVSALLTGFLELTGGVLALSGRLPDPSTLALAAFVLAWGGLSVHCQTVAVLQGSGLQLRGHLLGKLCHGLLAAAVTFVLAQAVPQSPTFVSLAASSHTASGGSPLIWVTALGWLGLAGACLGARKKGGKTNIDRL